MNNGNYFVYAKYLSEETGEIVHVNRIFKFNLPVKKTATYRVYWSPESKDLEKNYQSRKDIPLIDGKRDVRMLPGFYKAIILEEGETADIVQEKITEKRRRVPAQRIIATYNSAASSSNESDENINRKAQMKSSKDKGGRLDTAPPSLFSNMENKKKEEEKRLRLLREQANKLNAENRISSSDEEENDKKKENSKTYQAKRTNLSESEDVDFSPDDDDVPYIPPKKGPPKKRFCNSLLTAKTSQGKIPSSGVEKSASPKERVSRELFPAEMGSGKIPSGSEKQIADAAVSQAPNLSEAKIREIIQSELENYFQNSFWPKMGNYCGSKKNEDEPGDRWLFQEKIDKRKLVEGKIELYEDVAVPPENWISGTSPVHGDSQLVKNLIDIFYRIEDQAKKSWTGKPCNKNAKNEELYFANMKTAMTPEKRDRIQDLFQCWIEVHNPNISKEALEKRLMNFKEIVQEKLATADKQMKKRGKKNSAAVALKVPNEENESEDSVQETEKNNGKPQQSDEINEF